MRITHLPTGITVACQSERSHLKNREFAMRMLLGRLAVFQRSDAAERMSARQGEQRAIEWDNPIRSYVFQPCTLVQDHRTNAETRDIIAVMEGEIDPLIHAYLTQIRGNGR